MLPLLLSLATGVVVMLVAFFIWRQMQAQEAILEAPPEALSLSALAEAMHNPTMADVLRQIDAGGDELLEQDLTHALEASEKLLSAEHPSAAELEEAARLIGQVASQNPTDGELWALLTEVALGATRRGDGSWDPEGVAAVEILLEQSKKRKIEQGSFLGLKAHAKLVEGDLDAAGKILERAPDHWRVEVARARLAQVRGEDPGVHFDRAADLASGVRAEGLRATRSKATEPPARPRGRFTVELDVLEALLGDDIADVLVVEATGEDEDLISDVARLLPPPQLTWVFDDEAGNITLQRGEASSTVPVSKSPMERYRVVRALVEMLAPELELRVLRQSVEKEVRLFLVRPADYWMTEGRSLAQRFVRVDDKVNF